MTTEQQRPVRLVDIADKAGVSRRTVSCVLLGTGAGKIHVSAKTADRVRRIAQQLSYQPNTAAQQLAGKRSAVIGLIVENMIAPNHPTIIQGIESRAVELGYKIIIGYTQGRPELLKAYLEDFSRRQVEGLICLEWEWGTDHQAISSKWFQPHRHIVSFGNTQINAQGSVEPDRAAAAELLVRHLFDCGRRRIGLILDSRRAFSCNPRRSGYTAAHEAAGHPVDKNLIVLPAVGVSIPPAEVLEEAIQELVFKQKADAIMPYDDLWAVALIKHLKRHGLRVPEDVAVAGFGNFPVGLLIDPELTTVDMHLHPTANKLVELLDQMIHNRRLTDAERNVRLQPNLIVRASTGPR